jgi:methionine-rich copper-binding protein CopC
MKNKIHALRRSFLAALTLVLAFSTVFAVAPVQAANPMAETSASSKSADTFGLRFIYSLDAKRPSAADAMPVNVVIVRDGKAVAQVNNIQYGERFVRTLPKGIYRVDIYIRQTGQLIYSINLSHRTNEKDNGLSVVVRLQSTNPPPYPRVIYWVNGVEVK